MISDEERAFAAAILSNDPAKIQTMAQHNPSLLNLRNYPLFIAESLESYPASAVHLAVSSSGQPEALDMLIKLGAPCDSPMPSSGFNLTAGSTPLVFMMSEALRKPAIEPEVAYRTLRRLICFADVHTLYADPITEEGRPVSSSIFTFPLWEKNPWFARAWIDEGFEQEETKSAQYLTPVWHALLGAVVDSQTGQPRSQETFNRFVYQLAQAGVNFSKVSNFIKQNPDFLNDSSIKSHWVKETAHYDHDTRKGLTKFFGGSKSLDQVGKEMITRGLDYLRERSDSAEKELFKNGLPDIPAMVENGITPDIQTIMSVRGGQHLLTSDHWRGHEKELAHVVVAMQKATHHYWRKELGDFDMAKFTSEADTPAREVRFTELALQANAKRKDPIKRT